MSDPRKNEIYLLEVTELNNLGYGVAHLPDGRAVFVHGAVTGDTVEARLIKVTKTYAVARMERLVSASSFRPETDPCTAAESCGGCVFRHVTYAHECDCKRQYIQNAFRKAGLADVEIAPVVTTGQTCHYRNKAQYPVRNGKTGLEAGFFSTGTHRVVPAGKCPLQPEVFGKILESVCTFADGKAVRAYDEVTGKGLLRHIYLRYGENTGEIMVCLVLNGVSFPDEPGLVRMLTERFPGIVSILINRNEKNTNVVLGDHYRLLYGTPYLTDVLCGKRFRIAPESFYQVNHDAAERLYGIAADLAEAACKRENALVLDLYCGAGTIGLSMADRPFVGEVIGVEIVEGAVKCAKENAALNHTQNASFYCGDASDTEKLLSGVESERGTIFPDVVIIDPPRKGTTEQLISFLTARKVPAVVYVSCDPDTLARDCARFREKGYRVGTVTPVDLFPRTGHVETVVQLSKGEIQSKKIRVDFSLEDMDMSGFQKGATYGEIKAYVKEHTGLTVSSLYIAQVKQKCGIIERENYNKPKSENAKQPQCPPEKEAAIREALKHFRMIG